jgi:hypothetical protein
MHWLNIRMTNPKKVSFDKRQPGKRIVEINRGFL